MKRVIIESPWAGSPLHRDYALKCLHDTIRRGESGFASHLLWTQILDDMNVDERELGMKAGLAWYPVAEGSVVYIDKGVTPGMEAGIVEAEKFGIPVEMRRLEK